MKVYLTHAVVLGHVVHYLTLTFEGASQKFLRMVAATAPLGAEALKTWVLSMTDGIVEIELGSKVVFLRQSGLTETPQVLLWVQQWPTGDH